MLRSLYVLCLLFAVATAPAQTLRFDGVAGLAPATLGGVIELSVEGVPGLATWVALNINPGPTPLPSGASLPIGLDGGEALLVTGTPMPASGRLSISIPVPADLRFAGVVVFAAAVQVDPSAPDGLRVANGAAARLVRPGADAGPEDALLTGQSLTLDGRNGTVTAFPQWTIVDAPAGSSAVLTASGTILAGFTPDLPGRYLIQLQTGGASAPSADLVAIDVYALDFASPIDGSFHTAAFDVRGAASGPGPVSLSIDGSSVTVAGNGDWNAGQTSATQTQQLIRARLTTSTGRILERAVVVHGGAAAPVGQAASPAASLRLAGASLDGLEPPLELALGSIPLDPLLTAIPPLQVINNFFLSATFGFTQATYDPMVDVDLFPSTAGIGVSVTINNLVVNADVTGAILGAPYAEVATISATSTIISGDLIIQSAANGALELAIQNQSATMQGFQFNVTGALAGVGQLGVLSSGVQAALEAVLEGSLALIPTTLNPLLAGIPLTVDLSAQGIPLAIDFPLNAVNYDTGGITIATDLGLRSLQPTPPAVALQGVLTTPGSVPAFAATTPLTGASYDAAIALNDDALNQIFAALLGAGALDIDIDATGAPIGDPILAGALATILPGAGFETFPATAPVTAAVRHRVAPVITFDPMTGAGLLRLEGSRITWSVQDGTETAAVLDMGIGLSADLAITIDPVSSTLSIAASNPSLSAFFEGGLAGSNAANLLPGLSLLAPQLLPALLAPLQGLPLPSLGAGTGTVELSVTPSAPDNLALYIDLP